MLEEVRHDGGIDPHGFDVAAEDRPVDPVGGGAVAEAREATAVKHESRGGGAAPAPKGGVAEAERMARE